MHIGRRTLGIAIAGVAAGASLFAGAQTIPAVQRTAYFTAPNQAGAYVADLTAADVTVKEGGKEREIVRVEPSGARLKICFAIDESLVADDEVRRAAYRFI